MNGGVKITDEDLGTPTNENAWGALGEELGIEITEEQYKKYFNEETKEYDFKSHLVEANFKKQQADKKTDKPADADALPDADQAKAAAKAAEDAVAKAGLDMEVVSKEILENGDVSDASRKALNEVGITDEVIANHIEGVEAIAVVQLADTLAYLGGDEGIEQLKVLVDKAGWSKEKRGEIELALATPEWKKAADELLALKTGEPVKSDKPAAAEPDNDGIEGFKDQDELVLAMQDPRYRDRGPEGRKYRAEIMERARVSTYQLDPRAHTVGF